MNEDPSGHATAVICAGSIERMDVAGTANAETGAPLTASSVFYVGSLAKQFVAACVLLLVEDGKVSLSSDVHKYIPELADFGHKITINHLLTHTSGIRDWQTLLNLAGGDPDAMTMILRPDP